MLTARGAFFKAMTGVLRGDATLSAPTTGLAKSICYKRVPMTAALPAVRWQIQHEQRTRTFGNEAFRFFPFVVLAVWSDADGQNYMHGENICERLLYLLDGTEKPDADRVLAALNVFLNPEGWKATSCIEQTGIPPMEAQVGEDVTHVRWQMGYLFHAHLRKL